MARLPFFQTASLGKSGLFVCGRFAHNFRMPEEQAPSPSPTDRTSKDRNHRLKTLRREFRVSKVFSLNYLVYVPELLQGSRDEKCPTILFLHGLGESGEDPSAVLRQGLPPYMAQHPDFPFIVIAPQCPWNTWWPELADGLDQLLIHCTTTLPIAAALSDRLEHGRIRFLVLGGALAGTFCCRCPNLRRRDSFPWLSQESGTIEAHSCLGFSRGA
jgi:hypothetical protein